MYKIIVPKYVKSLFDHRKSELSSITKFDKVSDRSNNLTVIVQTLPTIYPISDADQ